MMRVLQRTKSRLAQYLPPPASSIVAYTIGYMSSTVGSVPVPSAAAVVAAIIADSVASIADISWVASIAGIASIAQAAASIAPIAGVA
jgi:hypothetical protein